MAKSATISFESCQKQCNDIISSAKKGNYTSLYLLHGTEGYFIDLVESYITQNALTEDEKAFNQTIIYGKDSTGAEVADAARRYPMLSEKQVIIVREAQTLKGLEDLSHYAENPTPSTVLVLCHRDKNLDKRSALYKKLAASKSCTIMESVAPRDWEVARFVSSLAAQRSLQIDPSGIQMIADNIGANLIRISSEIDKLQTRLGEDAFGRIITAADIEDNIGISKQYNNFELCKALSYRKFDSALKIAQFLSASSKDNPLFLTITALFTHFQRVTMVGFIRFDAQRQNKPVPNDNEIAKSIKIPNVYFLDEYKTAATNYSIAKCVTILGLLREWDLKSKGMGAGSTEESELLRDLILRISLC